MDNLLDENEQDLSKLLCFRGKDGQIGVMIGLLATVFFDNQLTREVREAVAEAAEDYIHRVRKHLRWTVPPNAKRECPIDSKRAILPEAWLPYISDGESWEMAFHGGETAKATSAFHLEAFGSKPYSDGGLGFLHVSFPLLWFGEGSETFPDYVLTICKRIRPLSGYGGIGVLEADDGFEQDKFQSLVKEIAERFPGLEVEDRVGHTDHLRTGIKGVNWLTILSDRWVKEVGGLDYLRAHLGESFGFYPYDGGLMIQAGPKPQIGDAQANLWPQHYVKLAKVLKKIQIKEHGSFHFSGANRMHREETKAWLFRFDNK